MTDQSSIAEQIERLRKLGGDGFVRKMIDLFVQTAPPRVEATCRATANGDLPAAEQAAHSLKSSAGYVGAVRARDLADQIEQLAASGKAEELPRLAAELSDSVNQVIEHLKQFTKSAEP